MPSFQDLTDRYVFANSDGTFTVWKEVTTEGTKRVGPGYIGRVIIRDGTRITEGFVDPSTSVNDPRMQGFGIVGIHHFRDIPNEPFIWNKGWELKGNLLPSVDPFGVRDCQVVVPPYLDMYGNIRASFLVNFVDRYSAAEGKRVLAVRYDYIVEDSNVKMWVSFVQFPDDFDSGPQPFIKEPKVSFSVAPDTSDGYRPSILDIFRADSSLLRNINLNTEPKLTDPTKGTVQIGFDTRSRCRFYDSRNYFNVVARGNTVLSYGADGKVINYGTRSDWEGGNGLDKWASLANPRDEFDPSVCGAYCKQGGGGEAGLTRQWELTKRGNEPQTQIMFHAWEGGSGLPDCLCCAKLYMPGETHAAYFSISRDAGWVN